jgi:hypothetical protein
MHRRRQETTLPPGTGLDGANLSGDGRSKQELDAEADEALAAARSMPSGPEKTEALKRAGFLRMAADAAGISFAKLGRPRK